jgi:hypothetical protein
VEGQGSLAEEEVKRSPSAANNVHPWLRAATIL